MEITEVRVKLVDDSDDRLQAFCSITFDDSFVVRDLKIIEGASGPFVAMPARKIAIHCSKCRAKNNSKATYCNHCGVRLTHTAHSSQPAKTAPGHEKLYADIAHPINSDCREMIQERVIAEFQAELERSKSKSIEVWHGATTRPEITSPLSPHLSRQSATESISPP